MNHEYMNLYLRHFYKGNIPYMLQFLRTETQNGGMTFSVSLKVINK